MRSLRGQLTIWFVGLLTVVGILAGIGTGLVSLREQNNLLDDQLRQIALGVGDSPSAVGESSRFLSGADPEDRIVVHILDDKMTSIRNSDPTVEIPVETDTGFTDHVSHGVAWRTFTLIAETRIIQVSQQSDIRTEGAVASALNTILPTVLLVPLAWLFVGWVVSRLLRPLRKLETTLLAPQGPRNVRLDPGGVPSEVRPLVDAMNDLLSRQHELLEFRQRFISDAAHQLRTPLTALTLQLNNLKAALGGAKTSAALQPMEQGLHRMAVLLGQLLSLARAEAPLEANEPAATDLSSCVRNSLAVVVDLAAAKGVDVGLTDDGTFQVRGESVDVTMLISNLLDNSVRYTAAGGAVDVAILPHGQGAEVVVSDTGPGIPPDALPLVFERFYRHAAADTEGSGLGLSIVAALAARCKAEVSLENRVDRSGLVARVRFQPAG